MCDCEQQQRTIASLSAQLLKISGLVDGLKMGTQELWEYSEPVSVGGPSGQYKIRAPFTGDCEYSVVNVNSGPQIGQIIISSSPKNSDIDFSGNLVLDEGTNYSGYMFRLAINTYVPSDTPFVPVADSNNTLYCHVGVSAGGAIFATIVFRQKRGVK